MELFKKNFIDVILQKYIAFEGRADRAEFWYFTLFNFIISSIIGFIFAPLAGLYALFVFLPALSVTARRLRDSGHSPWWIISMVFGIGIFIVLVLCALPSKPSSKK